METKLKTPKRASKASPKNGAGPKYDASARPLWEIACELSARIPEEELAKVPTDASTKLHYLQHPTQNSPSYCFNLPEL